MTIDLVRPVIFGIAGVIALGESNPASQTKMQDLAAGFEDASQSVSITWCGDQIAAVSRQHSEDALMMPGSYHYRLAEVGTCQGVAQGHFFSSPKGISINNEQDPFSISQVVVSGYVNHGVASFADLNGAWIAVVFDKIRQRVVLARDAVGVSTLYVAFNELQIVFASDLRLLRSAGIASEYDEQAILEFLHFLYVPSPHSVYRNVYSVLPGHVLIIEHQNVRQERFAPSRFVLGISLDDKEKVQVALQTYLPSFRERLLSAAESCVPQHGRIGLLLSAGKDSAALALAVKEVAPDRVVALTVGSPDPQFDESDYAARMCEFLGIPHIVYTPRSDELIPGFFNMVACQDQPTGDPASLPLLLASRCFPEDVSVIWDGTGNDYYFGVVREAGLRSYLRRVNIQERIPPHFWKILLFLMSVGPARFRSQAREWSQALEESFVSWNGWSLGELRDLCQREIMFNKSRIWEIMRHFPSHDWISLQTEIICGVWEPHAAFRKVMYLQNAYAQAVRFPFIDNRLASFVNRLPQELQFYNFTNKVILRHYLSDHLPTHLVQRPKGSFVFDQNALLQNRNALILKLLNAKGFLSIFPLWSDFEIKKMLSAYTKDPRGYVDRIYALVLLALWVALSQGKMDWDGL